MQTKTDPKKLIEELKRREAERVELLYTLALSMERGENASIKAIEAALREAGRSVSDFEEQLDLARNRIVWTGGKQYAGRLMQTCPYRAQRLKYDDVAKRLEQARQKLSSLQADARRNEEADATDRQGRLALQSGLIGCEQQAADLKGKAARLRKVAEAAQKELPDAEGLVAQLEGEETVAQRALLEP